MSNQGALLLPLRLDDGYALTACPHFPPSRHAVADPSSLGRDALAKMAREVQKRASGFSGGRGGAGGGGVPPKGALLGGTGLGLLIAGGLVVQSSLFNGS